MPRFDALIVGAGPAGSTCAWALRRLGMNVAVLDQANFPRDKVCAGWITPAVLHDLEIDPQEYGCERVLQPFTRFRVGLMDSVANANAAFDIRTVDILYPETVSYGIRRCEFDDYLLRRSQAQLFTGERVRSLRREAGEWLVNENFRAPMLVGAGGHACPVARALGARLGAEPTVVAQEIEILLPESVRATCGLNGEQPELYFCRDLAGYGWCIRKGDYLNIGLGRNDRQGLAAHVDGFLTFLRHARGVQALPGRFHGHAYLLHSQSQRELLADGALLIGDAAGLAYPQSGEGIRPAVESGLLAAQTVMEAQSDYCRQRLAPYVERLRMRFGQRASRTGSLTAAIPAWVRGPLTRSLFGHPTLVRRVILDHGFLHMRQPAPSPPAER